MCRDFYDVSGGSSADRTLPVVVSKLANQAYQSGVQANRIREVDIRMEENATDIHRLDMLQGNAQLHANSPQEKMTSTLFKIRDLREQQVTFDRRLMGAKQSDTESSSKHNPRSK